MINTSIISTKSHDIDCVFLSDFVELSNRKRWFYFRFVFYTNYFLYLRARARLLDIHDFFERFSKLGIENGIYYWVYKAVHVAEPSGKYESSNTR